MKKITVKSNSSRRGFLGTIATGAAALSVGSMISPLSLSAESLTTNSSNATADEWFAMVKGKHKIVFDCTRPNGLFPFAWPRVFLLTNEATGTMSKDNGVVVVLRHEAIPYAFDSSLWAKYKFGEMFKADDPESKQPSTRNPFWKPAQGAFKVPGFGVVQIGINELQDSGVMFCVCHAAMTVYSAVAADMMKTKAEDVLKEWEGAVLPGIQMVPSGVWAVGRAQEHGCTYCFAG